MEEKADGRGLGVWAFGERLRAGLIELVGVFMSGVSSFPSLFQVWRQQSTVERAMDLES